MRIPWHIALLLKRLLLVLVVFTLLRLVFIMVNHHYLQFGVVDNLLAFYYGLRFDISALVYLNGLFILLSLLWFNFTKTNLYQNILKVIYVTINATAVFLNLVDTGYIVFSGKRSGVEVFNLSSELDGVVLNYLIDFWYLLLLLVAFIALLIFCYPKIKNIAIEKVSAANRLFWIIFILTFAVLGARGGIRLLPINTFDAARMLNSNMVPVIVNTPFNMLMSLQQRGLEPLSFMGEKQAADIYSCEKKLNLNKTGKNIVLLIVESLGKEYVGAYTGKKTYTPFIDSLMQYSKVYLHAYANGKRSIEGIPAIMAAMPSMLQGDYISSYYQANKLNSTGSYLNHLGYDCSFYHGGKNGTMSFDNFLALTNGGAYFGLNQYPQAEKDYDGHWGIYDKPYLSYVANELKQKATPFFASIFTLSSHHPYSIPEQEAGIYDRGTLPIHASIGYADNSLRNFFAEAKKQPWYSNTVFYLVADHSAENETEKFRTMAGKFEIPLIRFDPNNSIAVSDSSTIQQTDIMGLILADAGFNGTYFSFGSAQGKQSGFAIQKTDGFYQLIRWPYIYQISEGSFKPLGFYCLKDDELMQKNLINARVYQEEIKGFDIFVKAFLQQYHQRLISNQTFVKD